MELMKAIALRKSTRSYKSEQISDESLNVILNAGCAAPVGKAAYNLVHLTIIQNSNLLDKFTKATATVFNNPNMKPFYGAPTLVDISGKIDEKTPDVRLANAVFIIENMTLAATDLGLGSVYLMGFLVSFSADKELNLPEGFTPV